MNNRLILLAAMDENRLIGSGGTLPWRMPADMRRFRELTTGHTVLMGRKTHLSIGKILPKRRNLILSRDASFTAHGAEIARSWEQVFGLISDNERVFLIGGAEVYRYALAKSLVAEMYLTEIKCAFSGDLYFPEYDARNWKLISEESHPADAENPCDYAFARYARLTLG